MVVHDSTAEDGLAGRVQLDHLTFDKNRKLPFVGRSICKPYGNQKTSVAAARGFGADGVHLVLARDEPLIRRIVRTFPVTGLPGT